MPVLQVTDLHKAYGSIRAVGGICLRIEAGEIFGLLGPNGAGKTTTINIIANLLPADRGEVVLNGKLTPLSSGYKHNLGYVPQDISLAEKLTARENLTLVGRLYDLRGAVLERRVDEILDAIGLTDRASDLVATYSGGMKRRLNIGGALLHEPALLLLDEPTVGVDPQARAYIFKIIEGLAEQGRGILYTTHYMEEAQRLCKRTAVIDHGKILADGTLAELARRAQAGRGLVIKAEALTQEAVSRLAARFDNAPWTLDGGEAHLDVPNGERALLKVARAADELGLRLTSISFEEADMETVFLKLTGRALRD